MTPNFNWCPYLFPIVIILYIFISLALRFPVLSIDEIPINEALLGPFFPPTSYILLDDNHYLQSNTNVNIPYFSLWILVGIVLIQMLLPSSKRLDPIFDIGINLLISAGVILTWAIVNLPTSILLSQWNPQIEIYTPLAGLLLVPFQRILIHNFRKRKNDDAPEINTEASH